MSNFQLEKAHKGIMPSALDKHSLDFLMEHGFEAYGKGWSRFNREGFSIDIRLYGNRLRIEWLERVPDDNVMGAVLDLRATTVIDVVPGDDIEPVVMGLLNDEKVVSMGFSLDVHSQAVRDAGLKLNG